MYCGIGQDSHRFLKETDSEKKCVIGGVVFEDVPGMDADSDGDVALHAICNAISSMTHTYILGEIAPKLCHEKKITDSSIYLSHALNSLKNISIHHVSLTIEGKKPRMQKKILAIRENIAKKMSLSVDQIGLTVTSGDGLSDFARGDGIQCFCMIIASN